MPRARRDPLAAAMRTIGRPLALAAGKTSTTSQGYGVEHQRQRQHLLDTTPDGWPCPWCGLPMYPKTNPASVHADHSTPTSLGGTLADRLMHSWCNQSRGNGTRARTGRGQQRTEPAARPVEPGQVRPASGTTRSW